MLDLHNVTVRYGAVRAVSEVSLAVRDGEVLALVGPSGCGKSTLLRAIAGIEPVSAGVVRWDGTDLARVPVHRRRFGLMFQDGVLFPHRSVAGNIGYGLPRGPQRDRRVRELLALVGLAGFGDRSVATLSGGQAQRVALARALAPRPRLLLLDEPLASLDTALRHTLLGDLRAVLRHAGTTSIYVTHDHDEAFAVAHRCAIMRAGEIAQTGTPADVWQHPADEDIARFIGYGTVLDADPHRHPDGSWTSDTVVGSVPGRGHRVGLRRGSLVADTSGDLTGEVIAHLPGPDSTVLTVDLSGRRFTAVDEQLRSWSSGSQVRLRFDPSRAAVIGSTP